LTDTERELMQNLVKKSGDWRERAQTILLLGEGCVTFEVAEKEGMFSDVVNQKQRDVVTAMVVFVSL
jgi:hypothetical protein